MEDNKEFQKNFYNSYLKPYEGRLHHTFIIMPFARRKYYSELTMITFNRCRELLSCKDMNLKKFLDLIDKVNFVIKSSIDPKTGKKIPRKAWVFYITANPLNDRQALFMHQESINRAIKEMVLGSTNIPFKAISNYKTSLHKSPYREVVKLDIDTKDPKLIQSLKSLFIENNIKIRYAVESRAGYHVLVPCGQDMKNLYLFAKKIKEEAKGSDPWLTIEGVSQSPHVVIPGICQSDDWLVKQSDFFDECL
tara:strand:- start:399 stop:1148 length:750 start_codon:yes stop_codon:yes gene_type:complete